MEDCLIVGGGVIGLSLAYELSKRGMKVRVLERGEPGQEASWAGAGLIPPAKRQTATDAHEALAGLSGELHIQWAAELAEATGIDTGFRRTGSIHIARDADSAEVLRQMAQLLRERQIAVQQVATSDLREIEPRLAHPALLDALQAAILLPDESQIRNPRHLKALTMACARRGVTVQTETEVENFVVRRSRIMAVQTSQGSLSADTVCLCGGAWTGTLAARLGVHLPTMPVRGQMLLLNAPTTVLTRIVNEGKRYIVPRPDGRILVGSTEEQAGFDKRTTVGGVESLLAFALDLVPDLAQLHIERTWAGLRPGTPDGLPYLGRLGELENAFVAAGHYRGGLHLSPGTAVVLSQLISGEAPEVDLAPFSPLRLGKQSEISPATA